MFAIKKLAFDPHKIDYLLPYLEELGCDVELVAHSQGFRRVQSNNLWMHESIEQVEQLIFEERLIVQNNPVLTWCVANAVIGSDASDNKKFEKRKSFGRIDGAVSLAMAVGVATAHHEDETSVYEERGIRYV